MLCGWQDDDPNAEQKKQKTQTTKSTTKKKKQFWRAPTWTAVVATVLLANLVISGGARSYGG